MPFIYTFIIMFVFWIVLSGRFDPFHLSLGLISSFLIASFSTDLLYRDRKKKNRLAEAWRFIKYVPWLVKEVYAATLHVVYLTLHPNMMDLIDPKIIIFKTKLKTDYAKVVLANSITLTPGTITIRFQGDEFYVHALDQKSAAGFPGEMEERIKRVFEKD